MLMLWDAVCYFLYLLKGVPGAAVVSRFYTALVSALEQTHCACM